MHTQNTAARLRVQMNDMPTARPWLPMTIKAHKQLNEICLNLSGFGYSGLASGTEQGHMDRLTVDVSTYVEVSI